VAEVFPRLTDHPTLEPCLPRPAKEPPAGPDWIHEIKHDGFRVIARRDGKKIRLISRKGKDLTYRFPLAVQAIAELPVNSCIIDGEAIISDATGLAVFSLVRSYRNGPRATLCAFDLIEIDGEDLRWRTIEGRKSLLKRLTCIPFPNVNSDATSPSLVAIRSATSSHNAASRARISPSGPCCCLASLRGHFGVSLFGTVRHDLHVHRRSSRP
jgi:ATP-dependent DNA ligase